MPARGSMRRRATLERRHLLAAPLRRARAARRERTAGRVVERAGCAAGDARERSSAIGVHRRHRGDERSGVGVRRPGDQRVDVELLDDSTRVHDEYAAAQLRDDGDVVRDENGGRAARDADFTQEAQNLLLHRHVERGRRLVGHDQLRLRHKPHRDHRALAHAAGELVRILTNTRLRVPDPDRTQPVDGAILRRPLRHVLVHLRNLGELAADAQRRIQRRHRILVDDRERPAEQSSPLGVAEQPGILAEEREARRGEPRARRQ